MLYTPWYGRWLDILHGLRTGLNGWPAYTLLMSALGRSAAHSVQCLRLAQSYQIPANLRTMLNIAHLKIIYGFITLTLVPEQNIVWPWRRGQVIGCAQITTTGTKDKWDLNWVVLQL